MSRASDLRPAQPKPEPQVEPQPSAPAKAPVVAIPDKPYFGTINRERLEAQEVVCQDHLAKIAELLLLYPAHKPSLADCQFISAVIYGCASRNALSPGQVKCLNSMHTKAKAKAKAGV